MDPSSLIVAGIPAAALVSAGVQVLRLSGMPARWAPAAAVALGLVAGLLAAVILHDAAAASWLTAILAGLWAGAGAVGGHTAVSHTINAIKADG